MMMKLAAAILIVLVLACSAHAQTSGLILNEALANEPGGDVNAEWVELLNWPDADSAVICVDDYRFIDGTDTSHYDTSYCLQPGGFLVITRDITTFESIWGNNSGEWGDHTSEDYPLLGGDISLRNSSDTLVLVAPNGDTSAIWWTSSTNDNTSWERIRPNGGDDISNFASCTDPSGSTPGRRNSVFPVVGDLAFDSLIAFEQPWVFRDSGALYMTVTNVGFGDVYASYTLFDDRNLSAPGTVLEKITVVDDLFPIGEEHSSSKYLRVYESFEDDLRHFMPGVHRYVGRITSDSNTSNNEAVAVVTVRYSFPLLIITEFLANPEVSGPDEWVEIVNLSEQALSMRSLRIGDSSASSAIPLLFDDYIQPGQYWVLAENETAFLSHYPDFNGTIVQVPSWPSLNNTGDRVTLVGAGGEIIDSVSFRTTHDDNHSWERMEMATDHAMIDEWTISVDPSGATPGEENSVDPDAAGTFTVSVAPNPIYLSAGEEMQIDYQLEIGEHVTLKVFDRSGRLVRTLADDTPAATGSVTWDATNDDGGRVRPGPYILLGKSEPAGATCKDVIVVAP